MQSSELEKHLLEAGEPPTMSHVALKVMELLSDPDFSSAQLARIIRADTGLATRILKIANSAFYGCPREIASLDRAILMLGARTVKNLTLAASTRQFHSDQGLVDRLLWEHSVAMAIGTHMIASQLKLPHHEDALVSGLLQNMGQVVMKKLFPEPFDAAIEQGYNNGMFFEEVELAHFSFRHCEVGAYMIRTWRLAESIEMIIAYQNNLGALQEASPDHMPLGAALDVTQALLRQLGLGERAPSEDIHLSESAGARFLQLEAKRLERFKEELLERYTVEREYFS